MTSLLLAARAWVATARVVYRAGRRAFPDAAEAAYRRGVVHGLRTWQRLVVADLSTLIAVDAAMTEATMEGCSREQERR